MVHVPITTLAVDKLIYQQLLDQLKTESWQALAEYVEMYTIYVSAASGLVYDVDLRQYACAVILGVESLPVIFRNNL